MKKIIIAFLLSLCISLITLAGCSIPNESYSEYKPQYGPQFICVEEYKDPYLGYIYILVDKNTRIMYMFVDDTDAKNRGLSVLYTSEGIPRKYSGAIIE